MSPLFKKFGVLAKKIREAVAEMVKNGMQFDFEKKTIRLPMPRKLVLAGEVDPTKIDTITVTNRSTGEECYPTHCFIEPCNMPLTGGWILVGAQLSYALRPVQPTPKTGQPRRSEVIPSGLIDGGIYGKLPDVDFDKLLCTVAQEADTKRVGIVTSFVLHPGGCIHVTFAPSDLDRDTGLPQPRVETDIRMMIFGADKNASTGGAKKAAAIPVIKPARDGGPRSPMDYEQRQWPLSDGFPE